MHENHWQQAVSRQALPFCMQSLAFTSAQPHLFLVLPRTVQYQRAAVAATAEQPEPLPLPRSFSHAAAVQIPALSSGGSAAGGGGGPSATRRQGFSISVANLVKLIMYAQSLPDFRGLGTDLTSNDLRVFLMRQGKHARDVFGQFFTLEAATAVLTYEWTLRLRDICTFLNGPTIRQHNDRTGSRIPDDPERLTVWIDVLQLNQNSPNMQAQLLQSETEYERADEHIILGTRTVGTRAWCLHEAATRARVGRRSHVLKSLRCEAEPRFDVAGFVAGTRGLFYEEMIATVPADLALIRHRINETYGSPGRFNCALLSIFQDAAF